MIMLSFVLLAHDDKYLHNNAYSAVLVLFVVYISVKTLVTANMF